MPIDLNRFAKKEQIILPIIDNKSIYRGRKFNFHNIENGWYLVETGDNPKVKSELDELEFTKMVERHKTIKGFVFNSEIIPISFNTLKQKYGMNASSVPVYFMKAHPWQVIKAICWEDNKLLYADIDFSYDDTALKQVKERFETERSLEGLKGITPEMRFLFVLFELEREVQRELLKKVKEEELKKSLAGRLKLAITRAGGKLIRFTKVRGNFLEVTWEVEGERFNSLIKSDLWAISIGFCVDGEDEKYNIERAIIVAKDFIDKDLIHKTRY